MKIYRKTIGDELRFRIIGRYGVTTYFSSKAKAIRDYKRLRHTKILRIFAQYATMKEFWDIPAHYWEGMPKDNKQRLLIEMYLECLSDKHALNRWRKIHIVNK